MADMQPQPVVKVFGRTGSPQCYAIRDFLSRNDVPFEWIELRSDEEARAVGLESATDRRLPVCVFPDGTRLERPSIQTVSEKLGWFHDPSRTEYDLAIYGAGPAGLSAAVYGASEGLKTVVVERWAVGGQAGSSPRIENYLGFPKGISGAELAERARAQACQVGAEILIAREGVRGEFTAGKRVGYLADGTKLVARSAICATGIDYHRLELPNEERLRGAGVYYGAGASEASLCVGHAVVVVGGGNSAAQATLHLSKYAPHVTLVVRGESRRREEQEDRRAPADRDALVVRVHRRLAAHRVGRRSGGCPRRSGLSRHRTRPAPERPATGSLAPRAATVSPGNQRPRPLRRRRRSSQLSQALRVSGGRGRDGRHLRAPIPCGRIAQYSTSRETELILKSRRVVPARLLEHGFTFRFPS
jgi:hypothetical protein